MTNTVPVFQNQLDEVACSQCGAPLRLRGMGRSSVIGCEYCGAINGLSGKQVELIEAGRRLIGQLLLPLGSRGKFENTEFEVIGCITRTDSSGQYAWREYLLFNPYRGYRWLVEQNAHWLYVSTEPKLAGLVDPTLGISSVSYEGENYKRFDSGVIKVLQVVGECYWEVKSGDSSLSTDYISPPFMLSFEKSDDEIVGSRGVYMYPAEVEEAFSQIKFKTPYPNGVAPTQPNLIKLNARLVGLTYVAILCILTFFQIIFLKQSDSKLLYTSNFDNAVNIEDSNSKLSNQVEKISTPFRIERGPSNLRVDINAPVDNTWVSVFVSLINEQGDLVDEKEVEVSYYHGYDSDGSWSEGADRNYAYFERVPSGTYTISTTASTNMKNTLYVPSGRHSSASSVLGQGYSLKTYNKVPYWGNYLFVLAMVSIYPIYLKIRSASFEAKRNQNSTELSGGED